VAGLKCAAPPASSYHAATATEMQVHEVGAPTPTWSVSASAHSTAHVLDCKRTRHSACVPASARGTACACVASAVPLSARKARMGGSHAQGVRASVRCRGHARAPDTRAADDHSGVAVDVWYWCATAAHTAMQALFHASSPFPLRVRCIGALCTVCSAALGLAMAARG